MRRDKALAKSSDTQHLLPYRAILCVVTVALYVNTLGNGFTLDDRTLVLEDPRIQSLSHVGEILAGGYRYGVTNNLYRPVTVLTLLLNRSITGADPWGFHLVNLLLHLAATLLLYQVSQKVFGSRTCGFFAALFFGVHPVHTEAVANIVGRAELLVSACLLGSLWLLLQTLGQNFSQAYRHTFGALVLFAFALLAKENAVTFVGIWVLLSFHLQKERSLIQRTRLVLRDYKFWSLIVVSFLYLALRRIVLGAVVPGAQVEITYAENPLLFASGQTRILTAIQVLVRYLWLLVWPYNLSADYSFDQIGLAHHWLEPAPLFSLLILMGLGALALATARRAPIYLLAYGFFLVSISLVSNLVIPIGTIMAERLVYFPSVGFCWALAQFFHQRGWASKLEESLMRRSLSCVGLPAFAVAIILVPWGAKTLVRNREWKDDLTLFRATVATAPKSAKAHILLADTFFRNQDYTAAIKEYQASLQIYPDYAGAAINLASAYDAQGRYREAVDLLRSFERRSGRFEVARLRELGRALVGLNDFPRAAEAYELALQMAESDALAHRNLGAICLQYLGKPEKGRAHLERSLELAPDQPGAEQLRATLHGR